MNTTKKINVNFSSLVGLKAELLRKQTEVNDAKLRSETVHNFPKAKVKKKPKKAKKENEDEKPQQAEYIEDVNTHKKSKLMLEAKARLYNKLKRSKHNDENFLVDFTNKSDESEDEASQKDEEDENDESFANDDDDWVEYEDCFGRTRKCLREDLLLMREKDNLIKQQIVTKKGVDPRANGSVEQTSAEVEKEPEIEIMRRKWEEQTQKLADKANIHYQDVLFDEARAHGVGYFAFSQDEEQRAKQQENLSTLRKETERKQKEIKELRELREKMEQNRLKAARIRQRIRAGLPVEPLEELEQKDDNRPDAGAPEVANEPAEETANEIKEEEQVTEEDRAIEKENKIKALGALLGKRNYWYEMSQEEWVHKCRKVRLDEFAPVYNNFKSAGYLASADNDEPSNHRSDEALESETRNEAQNANEVNIDSYDIPLPPSSPPNVNEMDSYDIPLPPTFPEKDSNVEDKSDAIAESDGQNNLAEAIYEFNTADSSSSDAAQSQASNRNIDEASIAAGLRYLRQKFEESRHT